MFKDWFDTRLRGFADRSGNVSVIFALSLLPMIGLVGLGVDLSRSLTAKTMLDSSADAAALSAVTQAQATLQSSSNSSDVATAIYAGQLAGQRVFSVNAAKAGTMLANGVPTPSIAVSQNTPTTLTASVSYSGAVNTVFGGMFGTRTVAVQGAASSSLTMPTYMNISVAVDISQSMGLAATPADMARMQSLTGGCAFGCHVSTDGHSPSYETQAHLSVPPILLRIDVIRQATQNMIKTAQSMSQGSSGLISFGLYELQGASTNNPGSQPFTTLASPTLPASQATYNSLYASAGQIDLGSNTTAGVGDSDFPDSMASLTTTVPTSGAGLTSSAPQQYVFLMTDGVQDTQGSCVDGHCTKAFDPAQCDALKRKGVTVGVIYTTYLAMPDEQTYRDLVQPFASSLAPNLQACATSASWFYQATDASDIQAAINALFAKATGHGILIR